MQEVLGPDEAQRVVIFDFDGTLFDVEAGMYEILEKVYSEFFQRSVSQQEIRDVYIPEWRQLTVNLGKENVSEDDYKWLINRFSKISQTQPKKAKPFPEIPNIVQLLSEWKFSLLLWTGRDRSSALEMLKAHQLNHFFYTLWFGTDSPAKPHTAGLSEMLGGCPKDKCLLIGDSQVDVLGAKEFGIQCLVVDWNRALNEKNLQEILSMGASAVCHSGEDLLTWLCQLLNWEKPNV